MSSSRDVSVTEPAGVPGGAQTAGNRYLVTLKCPTPVAFPELEVEAASADEAWQKFCAANRITGSEHPRTIVPL